MGLKPVLFFIPIAVMLVAIAVTAGVGAVSGQGQLCANSQGQTPCASFVSGQSFTLGSPCPTFLLMSNVPFGSYYVTSCSNSLGSDFSSETVVLFTPQLIQPNTIGALINCEITSGCPTQVYPVTSVSFYHITLGSPVLAVCNPSSGNPVTVNWVCIISVPYSSSQPVVSTGLFSFIANVGIDTNGWILIAITLVGVAAIASINIFSSGQNTEGTHILFVGGGMVAIWLILVLVEGFPGSSEVFFNSINSLIPAGGTAIFMIITLIYASSIFTAISRGV